VELGWGKERLAALGPENELLHNGFQGDFEELMEAYHQVHQNIGKPSNNFSNAASSLQTSLDAAKSASDVVAAWAGDGKAVMHSLGDAFQEDPSLSDPALKQLAHASRVVLAPILLASLKKMSINPEGSMEDLKNGTINVGAGVKSADAVVVAVGLVTLYMSMKAHMQDELHYCAHLRDFGYAALLEYLEFVWWELVGSPGAPSEPWVDLCEHTASAISSAVVGFASNAGFAQLAREATVLAEKENAVKDLTDLLYTEIPEGRAHLCARIFNIINGTLKHNNTRNAAGILPAVCAKVPPRVHCGGPDDCGGRAAAHSPLL